MRPVLGILLGVCAAQVVMVGKAEADQGLAVLTGTVTNAATGEPVEGVVVVAASNSMQGEATMTTDRTGHFRLPSLPPGAYRLEVLGNGFQPFAREGITLRAGSTIRVNAALTAAGGEVREIEVAAPTVDVGSSSTGVSLDSDFSKRVPVVSPGGGRGSANRSFDAVATATPGARADGYGTSVSGTTSPENQYLVDGVSVGHAGFGTNGLSLSSEFVSEVSVISGGYMPEYGRAAGGIMSAVTKSGSNEFHGGVWAFYTPGAIEGKRKEVDRSTDSIVANSELAGLGDIGFDIGGPLIKDKLWFYVGFDIARTQIKVKGSWHKILTDDNGMPQVDEETEEVLRQKIDGSDHEYDQVLTEIQSLAKLTFRANENHRITLSGVFAPRRSGSESQYAVSDLSFNPLSSLNGDFESNASTRHGYAATSQLKWNATSKDKKWVFDTNLSYNFLRTTSLPVDGSEIGATTGLAGTPAALWRQDTPLYNNLADITEMPGTADRAECDSVPINGSDDPDQVTVVCPTDGYWTGGPGWIFDRRGSTYALAHTVTRVFNAAGHHVVKFGADGNYVDYTTRRGYTGGASFGQSFDRDGWYDWVARRQYGFLVEPNEPHLIRNMNRTTTSFTVGGFVQDSWSIADTFTLNIGGRYDMQNVYKADGTLFISLPNQLSPRVGFIYDWTKEGRSKVFANYARFFQSVPMGIADRGGSGEPQTYAYYLCENPATDVDECYDNAQTLPWATGATTEYGMFGAGSLPVDPDLKPPSSDEIVAGVEYEVFERARVGAAYTKRWINRIIEDMSRDEATTYFLGNPGEGIAADFPEAERDYDAVNIYFQRGFHKNWMLMGSYTLSWLRGNIAGLYRPSTGQLDPFVNSDFDLLSLLPNRTGPLSGDNRHWIKLFGAGEIPINDRSAIAVGGGINARSGGPTNYYGAHIQYGTDEVFILPRGEGERLPWRFSLDVNLGYVFAITEDVRVRATIDIFNLPNFQQVTQRDESYTYDDVTPIEGGTTEDLANLIVAGSEDDPEPATQNRNFGRATRFQTPRQFRFGLRFEF
ncbi:MAG: TonB-dependent receptor [Myxococcales bacterium FL481]|nr:MAG: TonB-dependent receptor [Myxococcales bacterium FL481]